MYARAKLRRWLTGATVVATMSLPLALLSPASGVAAAAPSATSMSSPSQVAAAASRVPVKKKLTAKQRAAIKRAKKRAAIKRAKKRAYQRKLALAAAQRRAAAVAAAAAAARQKPTPVAPTTGPAPAPVASDAVSVTSFGAVGDGVTDNCLAIQEALGSIRTGGTLVFPAGKVFAHSCVLRVSRAGVRLTGGGQLRATNERRSSLFIDAPSVTVDNLTLTMVTPTQRWEEYEQMRLRIGSVSGVKINNITIDGAAAAGVYVGGASNFALDHIEVRNTRADAVHITESAHDGTVTDATVRNAGDDGVAIVSYGSAASPCKDITVTRPKMYGQRWGRAFSVVGGDRITFRDIYAEQSSGATVYIASEGGGYNTWTSRNIVVDGGAIVGANQTSSVDHGAVMIYNGRNAVNSDITVKNLSIANTRSTASRQVGVIQDSGGTHARVSLSNIAITGGSNPFGSNAPSSSYNRTGMTFNGVALPNLIGWH